MASRPDALKAAQLIKELQTDVVLEKSIQAQMYLRYRAVVIHPEFPRLLELYKKEGTKTRTENAEYDSIHSRIFRETYAMFEIIDKALAIHSKTI